jgi:hypothetical protein
MVLVAVTELKFDTEVTFDEGENNRHDKKRNEQQGSQGKESQSLTKNVRGVR